MSSIQPVFPMLLHLPHEILVKIALLLDYEDLINFIAVDQVLPLLGDDIQLLSTSHKQPHFFHLPWNQAQTITLKLDNKSDHDDHGDAYEKRHKVIYPGRIHLIELPEYPLLDPSFNIRRFLESNNKKAFIALSNTGLEREAELSFTKITQMRTLSDPNSERQIADISFHLQKIIPTLPTHFPNASIIIKNLESFTCFDSLIDPQTFHFPDLKSLCLVNAKLPKSLTKFILPNLEILRIEENYQSYRSGSSVTSTLSLMDLSKYPTSQFWYNYTAFVPSENNISMFIRDISFDQLRDLCVLESVSYWTDIRFPLLDTLFISTIHKNDHSKYSHFKNIEAPNLNKLIIEYDCGHFPRINGLKFPKSAEISIKSVCNVYWAHHHDTTLISAVNQWLDDYEHLELRDAMDLLGCTPLSSLKTLKLTCSSIYWHMSIATVPVPLKNLEKLVIKFDHETLPEIPWVPSKRLKELKTAHMMSYCYSLDDINSQYPVLEKLQISFNNLEKPTTLQPEFKHLQSLIIYVNREIQWTDLMRVLQTKNFPKLIDLTIAGEFKETEIELNLPNAPNIQYLNLFNCYNLSKKSQYFSLSIKGFKNLQVLSFPPQFINVTIDDLTTVQRIILPEDDENQTYNINGHIISDDSTFPNHPKTEIETILDNPNFTNVHLQNEDFSWPNYSIISDYTED